MEGEGERIQGRMEASPVAMEAKHAEGVRRAAADRGAGSESRESEPVAMESAS